MLLFADDVAIFAQSLTKLCTIFSSFADFCTSNHLSINEDKTKLLVCGKVDPACIPG